MPNATATAEPTDPYATLAVKPVEAFPAFAGGVQRKPFSPTLTKLLTESYANTKAFAINVKSKVHGEEVIRELKRHAKYAKENGIHSEPVSAITRISDDGKTVTVVARNVRPKAPNTPEGTTADGAGSDAS